MKMITVIGARPQFIKAAIISREINKSYDGITEIILHTGQHYDENMSDIFFSELDIPVPNYNLNIGGGTHGSNTGRMLEGIEAIIIKERPDLVLVYGDTDSTLAGALAACKLNIPVAHVEAGLRSFNKKMPEEVNRVLVDHVSTILFSPTTSASINLRNEGLLENKINMVGDVMYDAAMYYKSRARCPGPLVDFNLKKYRFVLCTIHRAENTNESERLGSILEGLKRSGKQIVLPLHPRTRKVISDQNLNIPKNVYILDPVGYLEMVWLEANCDLVVTDSGGVQKEAYFHRKRCVTLREETEWVELVDAGVNHLVGSNPDLIEYWLNDDRSIELADLLYGDGAAGSKIVQILKTTDLTR